MSKYLDASGLAEVWSLVGEKIENETQVCKIKTVTTGAAASSVSLDITDIDWSKYLYVWVDITYQLSNNAAACQIRFNNSEQYEYYRKDPMNTNYSYGDSFYISRISGNTDGTQHVFFKINGNVYGVYSNPNGEYKEEANNYSYLFYTNYVNYSNFSTINLVPTSGNVNAGATFTVYGFKRG